MGPADVPGPAGPIEQRMAASQDFALAALAAPSRTAAPPLPAPTLARTTRATLAHMLSHPDPAFVALLSQSALDAAPFARAHQLAGGHWLFARPLPWERLPRAVSAMGRLWRMIEAAVGPWTLGPYGDVAAITGGATLAELYPHTYFGGHQPMFATLAHDLVALGLDGPFPGGDAAAWRRLDLHLEAVWIHELAHLGPGRDAITPPYLDEALAGFLNVLVAPGRVFPSPEAPSPLVGWPTFSQLGQALCRAFGLGPVLRAHAGAAPWREVIPRALLEAIEAHWRAEIAASPNVTAHPDTSRPDRWAKLIYLAAAGEDPKALAHPGGLEALDRRPMPTLGPTGPVTDADILAHGLLAMTLEARQDAHHHWRVCRRAGPTEIHVDAGVGALWSPQAPGLHHALPPRGLRSQVVTVPGHGPGVDHAPLSAVAPVVERLLAG